MSYQSVFDKYERLKHILRPAGKVAIAFSGGVDSSLLLFAAIEVLGNNSVLALHGRSCLNITENDIEDFHKAAFPGHHGLIVIELAPLTWPEFIENSSKRCYHCKKKTYGSFLDYLQGQGNMALADGTNCDDLGDDRPGLAVINEYKIRTPLADAGLTKKEIRFLAQMFGLQNYDKPSNSCLATRIASSRQINVNTLETIEKIEHHLKMMGYDGCRAKQTDMGLIIQLRQQDFRKFVQMHNRLRVAELCREHGFGTLYLEIKGRL